MFIFLCIAAVWAVPRQYEPLLGSISITDFITEEPVSFDVQRYSKTDGLLVINVDSNLKFHVGGKSDHKIIHLDQNSNLILSRVQNMLREKWTVTLDDECAFNAHWKIFTIYWDLVISQSDSSKPFIEVREISKRGRVVTPFATRFEVLDVRDEKDQVMAIVETIRDSDASFLNFFYFLSIKPDQDLALMVAILQIIDFKYEALIEGMEKAGINPFKKH